MENGPSLIEASLCPGDDIIADPVRPAELLEIDQAIVLCEGNVNEAGKVAYLPAYMIMFV